MANTEIDPFAYNPAAADSMFGALPPQAAPQETDISQYLPQAAAQPQPMQGRGSSYDEAFQQAENQYGLPSGLLSTIGFHESRFNPNAVSPAGATGLMQLMPPTAKEYGVNARDPYASIDAAGKKMAGLVKYYNGDMAKAVAAYNYGEGNLDKAIRKAGDNWISATPKETQFYVSKVLGGQQGPQEDTYAIPLASGKTLYAPKGMPREEALASAREQGVDAVGLRDIALASGKTLQVPEHLSDEEAIKQASEAHPDIDFTLAKKETADRTTGGFFKDVGATTLKGVTSLAQSVIGLADIITPGDLGAAVENNIVDLSKYQDYLDKQFSPQTQEAIKNLNEAHGLGNILQVAKDNPSAVLSMIGQVAPQMVGAAGPAKAALFGLGKLAGVAPSLAPAIAKYGSYAAAGIGEATEATGGTKENLRTTNPEGEATGANTIAALGTGAGTAILGGAGAKLTTALGGVDPTIFFMGGKQAAINAVGDIANTPGFFKSTLVSMVGEGVLEEAPQSAVEQVFQNYAEGKTGEGLLEGVPDSAFKGALIGAVMGGGINVGSRIAQPAVQPPPPPPPAGQEPPIAGEVPEVPATTTTEPLFTAEDEALLAASEAKGKKGKAAVVPPVSEAPVAEAPVAEAVAEPVVRPASTDWVKDTLGLGKASGVSKALKGLDIDNPADHDAITHVLMNKQYTSKFKLTPVQQTALETRMSAVTPPVQGAPDAQQIPGTSPINGDGSTQSQESQAAEDITQAGEGMESGGQGIEAIETGGQEEVAPAVSSVMVAKANKVLEDYKEKPISRNIGRLRTIAETLELPVTVDTPHAEVYDLVARAIAPAQDMGRGIQINANEQGIDSVINKAAKQDEVVDEGLQARWIQHAKEGTLHKAEDDVTDFHYDLKTSNPYAHAKAEQVNTQAIKAVEAKQTEGVTTTPITEAAITDTIEEAKTTNLEAIKKAVEAKQTEGVTTTPITEAAITDTIEEANLNPEDDNYLSEQGDDFSRYNYPSVAPTSELTGHTAASLSKTLSPEMKRLVASGKAVMHDTAETLPEGKHPENVQGLTTAEGVTHYVANKLTPETLENVALHEVGTHVGMENLVGSKVYKDIANQALNNVGEVFDKARASIPKDTPTHLRHHEALAYLVENAPNLPVVKKIVSAVRNFARMHLGMKLQLTEADARHLAVKALRRESKTAVRTARKEGTAYSLKGPSQAAKDLGKIVADANLVKTSDKKPLDSVKEGVENAIKQSTLTRLRKSWIDASAGLSKALSSLPSMSLKGELRADLLHSKNQQLYNLVRTSFEKGYLVLSEDGGLMSTDDSELALNNIFKRIDELGYPDSRKTFFTAMRVMAGESNLLHDAHQRGLAQRYEKYVKLRKKEIDTLTGKERTKLINKLNGLKAEAKRIYERAGKKSLTDMQDEITTKTALAQKKEALAAATADPITKAKLTDAAAKLREAIDKLSEKTESGGVGTEKRVDAQHILDTKKLLASDDRLELIMADIYAALHKSVDLWEQSGLIDSDTANNWRKNPAYIPLYKSIDDLLEDPSKYVQVLKSGAKALGKVHAREGGLHDVNVGENLVKHFAFMAGAAAQNQYRKIASYQLASVGGAKISGPDDPQATKFKEDGKDVYYRIEDPVAFEAFQVAIPVLGAFSKVAQQYTKVFRGVTLINPVYWYRQLIRDPMMANLVSQTGFITPLHSLKAMAEILTNRSKSYETLKKHGVVGAVDSLTDPAQFVKAAATKRGTGRKFKDWIMHVHESSDAATRVAVYDKALKDAAKRGMVGEHAENYAVMRSREIINFSKKGNSQSLAAIRATVPFFSAQLNGMDTLARAAMPGTYGNLNKAEAAQARKHFYTNAAILTTISMSYALAMQDDEEYKKSPDWVNSWLVPTGDKDKPFFKIPIPFEAGFFFKVIPELIVRLNSGTMSQAQAEKELGKAAIGLLAPSFPLPQILKPMAEVATNYDIHTGNTIENFSESMLPMEQRSAHASNLSKLLGEYLPISPDNVEHLGRGWFTEAWAMSAALSDAYLNKGVSAPEKEWGEMPMLKGVFTAPGKDRALSEYYDASKSATQIRNAIMAANKVGDRETVDAIKSDPDKLKQFKASSVLQDMGTSISAMQHNIKRIKAMKDTEITPEEKTKRIRVVQDRINKLAQKALVVGKRFGLDL